MKRSARDIADASKRAGRRRRTDLLDLGLRLAAAWFRDWRPSPRAPPTSPTTATA